VGISTISEISKIIRKKTKRRMISDEDEEDDRPTNFGERQYDLVGQMDNMTLSVKWRPSAR
tara:strand:- start:815 stop:997 length:183 start_codon:yes stop_codon:yes gene_type:complete